MAVRYSAGDESRRYKQDDDYRGTFGRDRDRILYSSAFRRLAGKTQVVAVGELGDFHTRMTHTVKVAQLGRRLAERLQQQAMEQNVGPVGDRMCPTSPDLVEAACLAHDIGHPPFGHAGEHALGEAVDALVRRRAKAEGLDDAAAEHKVLEFGGFEGNAQTLRLLVFLGSRPPEHSRGLDLSRATLDATIKYPWKRGTTGKSKRKWNVYPEDVDYADWIREGQGWGQESSGQCFEAQLMDWCDDVAYACHDVEDFYRAGIIPLHQLFDFPALGPTPATNTLPVAARPFFDFVARKWTDAGRTWDEDEAISVWRGLQQFTWLPGAYEPSRAIKVALHRTTSQLITHLTEKTRWVGDAPFRYAGKLEVDAPGESRRRLGCNLLQELIWYYVIERPALASQQHGQQKIVTDLMEIFAEPANERLLPADRREDLEGGVDLLRVAVDHVAWLTEPRAEALHHRLTGIRSGQHSDPIWG